MFSFSKMFKYVWPQIKKFKVGFYTILALFSVRMVVDAILRPFYFKKIIDLISLPGVDHTHIAYGVFKLVFIIIALNVTAHVLARVVKFFYYNFQINMM